MTEVKIEIPFLPGRELSPNWHGHWARRYQAGQTLKEAAWALAKEAQVPCFKKAKVQITYVVKTYRTRDPDNALAMVKFAIDGLVAAGVFGDDDYETIKYMPVVFRIRPKEPSRTIIEIRGIVLS